MSGRRASRVGAIFAAAVAMLVSSAPAWAHIFLDYPPSRNGNQKEGPCEGEAKGEPTVLAPGQTITVKWRETVDHPSHYRIAFDSDGEDDFVDPTSVDDLYNNDAVLADDLPDKNKGSYTYELTLPDIECETCTLQVIQVMYTSGGGFNGLYHRCADIALRAAPAVDAMPEIGVDAMPGTAVDAMPGMAVDAMPQLPIDAASGGRTDAMGSPAQGGVVGGCQTGGGGGGSFAGLCLLVLGAVGIGLRRRDPRSANR